MKQAATAAVVHRALGLVREGMRRGAISGRDIASPNGSVQGIGAWTAALLARAGYRVMEGAPGFKECLGLHGLCFPPREWFEGGEPSPAEVADAIDRYLAGAEWPYDP